MASAEGVIRVSFSTGTVPRTTARTGARLGSRPAGSGVRFLRWADGGGCGVMPVCDEDGGAVAGRGECGDDAGCVSCPVIMRSTVRR